MIASIGAAAAIVVVVVVVVVVIAMSGSVKNPNSAAANNSAPRVTAVSPATPVTTIARPPPSPTSVARPKQTSAVPPEPAHPARPKHAHTAPPKSTLPATQSNIELTQVARSPYLAQVSTLLDTYFTGINQHDGRKAASVFAANGSINPNDPSQVNQFARGISTTHDDKISIESIRPATFDGQPGLAVRIHFRSQQTAPFGPRNETCTNWVLTSKLVKSDNSYKLLGSQDVINSAC